MVINPTYLAQKTRSSTSWQDAQRRVIHAYRQWLRSVSHERRPPLESTEADVGLHIKAPEIQQMYSLNLPVSQLRTKVRQEFERHRYVNKLPVVDMLLFQSHSEFQETLNYWKQIPHVMKYFRDTENPTARLPAGFMQGFLEGRN